MSKDIQVYEERIAAIKKYFNVSEIAAVYIYFRRKRGAPWKSTADPKYIEWTNHIRDALIAADGIFGFDWNSLEFGREESMLANYGIEISKSCEDKEHGSPQNYSSNDGWITVSRKQRVSREIKLLQKIGLLE